MTSDNPDANSSRPHPLKRIADKINRLKRKKKECSEGFFNCSYYLNLEHPKQKMIKGVIELSETNVREIMIPRVDVLALPHDADLKAVIKDIYDSGFSRIPVYKDSIDNITGILYVKDLLKYFNDGLKKVQLEKVLHKPFYVPETMPLDDLLVQFKKRKLHLAVVVDEYGGMSGVITLEDIIEEIVGEIEDEFDDEVPEMQKIRKNVYRVDSRMAISDFNDETGAGLPTDDFDTIGGLVFDLFGKVPQKNETIKFQDILFKVNDIKGARINRITVTIPEAVQSE